MEWWAPHAPLQVFTDQGITCAVSPGGLPGFNGYVYLPEGHPWRAFLPDYDAIPALVHGGLTFADETGWIGFDTQHYCDRWDPAEVEKYHIRLDPEIVKRWKRLDELGIMDEYAEITWTMDLLVQEIKQLAAQVREAM